MTASIEYLWNTTILVILATLPAKYLGGIITSFAVQSSVVGNTTQPTGQTVELLCRYEGTTLTLMSIYKTPYDDVDVGVTSAFATCKNGCAPSMNGPYEFSIASSNGWAILTTKINGINRNSDEMWWTCGAIDSAKHKKSFKLTVATEPNGIIIPSVPTCDLAYTPCAVVCQTTSCTHPSPSLFSWFYTTDGTTGSDIFESTNTVLTGTGASCSAPEKIYKSAITIHKYTTLPNNTAQAIRIFCRLKFATLTNHLTSNLSDSIQMAVRVKDVTIEPALEDELIVTEYQPKTVQCRTSGCRPASAVVWYKQHEINRVNITDGITTDTRKSDDLIVTISTLIFQATRQDQGWNLSCSASNFGNEMSATDKKSLNVFYLNITTFTAGLFDGQQSAGSTTVYEHTYVRGICKVNSNPSSTIKVLQSGVVIAQEDTSSELHFRMTNVTCSNNGKIICRAYTHESSLGIVEESLQLNVRCSPRLENNIDPVILAREETTAVLSLSVLAFPPPKYFWHRRVNNEWGLVTNNSEFLITSKYSEYNLTVISIQKQHYGEYDLTAFTCNDEDQPLRFSFFLENKESSSLVDKVNPESSSVAGAVGGTVGGVIAVCLIIVAIVCVLRKTRLIKDMKTKALSKRPSMEQDDIKGQLESTTQVELAYMQLNVAGIETDRYESLELSQKAKPEGKRQKRDKRYENPTDFQDDTCSRGNEDRKSMPSVLDGRQSMADQCYENLKTKKNKPT